MDVCFSATSQVCGELYGRTRTRPEIPSDLRALCNSFPRNLYLLGPPPGSRPSIDDASVSAASASRFEKDRAHSLDFPEVPYPTFDADRRPRDNGSVETKHSRRSRCILRRSPMCRGHGKTQLSRGSEIYGSSTATARLASHRNL